MLKYFAALFVLILINFPTYFFNDWTKLFSDLVKFVHGKNDFEVFKNLDRYRSENNFVQNIKILLTYTLNYVGRSNWLLKYQNFLQYCSLCLTFLQFDGPTFIFRSISLAKVSKFLDTSAKPSFRLGIINIDKMNNVINTSDLQKLKWVTEQCCVIK